MRSQGRYRQILNTITGLMETSNCPATREEALIEDVAKYYPPHPCPKCGRRTTYFTRTGSPACCAHQEAVDAYNEAVLVRKEPHNITEAQARGLNYFWTPMANSYCGHPGKITFSGRCVICAENKANSPRQLAIKSGAAWYTPTADDPCSKGHLALRRVANGSCKQCEEDHRATPEADQPINKLCPDMEISREDARGLGFKVYRTGKACSKGHFGWRYISTGGCLTCMGR